MADIVLFVLVEGLAATDKLGLPPAVDWLVRHASAMIVCAAGVISKISPQKVTRSPEMAFWLKW